MNLIELPIDTITPSPRNIRTDLGDLTELADSIKAVGILQPLVVVPKGAPGEGFVLVAGHRRLAAAKEAGLASVPAVVNHNLVGDADITVAMLIENVARRDLNPIEEAVAYEQLGLFGLSAADIAKRTGRSKHLVESRTKLMGLSEWVRQGIAAHQVTLTQAEAMLEFADDPAAIATLEGVLYNDSAFRWTVGDLQRRREAARNPKPVPAAKPEQSEKPATCRWCFAKSATIDGRCQKCHEQHLKREAENAQRDTANRVRMTWAREQLQVRDRMEFIGELARAAVAMNFDQAFDEEQDEAICEALGIGHDADTAPDMKDVSALDALAMVVLWHLEMFHETYQPARALGALSEFAGYEMSDEERAMFDAWDAKQ